MCTIRGNKNHINTPQEIWLILKVQHFLFTHCENNWGQKARINFTLMIFLSHCSFAVAFHWLACNVEESIFYVQVNNCLTLLQDLACEKQYCLGLIPFKNLP